MSGRSGRRSPSAMTGSRLTTRLRQSGVWGSRSVRMHRKVEDRSDVVGQGYVGEKLISTNPATGKHMWESRTEVAAVVNKVEISIEAYAERTPQRRMEAALGNKVTVRHKPHGVLAVLGPYNFPAHLPNGHIVPALIAGNAVVFKPSEKTPATGEMLVRCFHEAGIPEGVVRLLIGGPDQGRSLAGQAGIDGLLFTGSARAGMALHKQFAETPHKILALELGGNNPMVVWNAKDIDSAATIAVQSAYLSAGQRCTAARRLIVEEGAEAEL